MNPKSGKKQIFQEHEFDDLYVAKKFFDYFEYKDKDVLFNKKLFKSMITDFTKNLVKNNRQMLCAYNKESTNDADNDKKLKKIRRKKLSSNETGNIFDII
jgi:hypothetical protein